MDERLGGSLSGNAVLDESGTVVTSVVNGIKHEQINPFGFLGEGLKNASGNDSGDAVSHPSHYQLSNGMEVIDVIKGALTPEQYEGYLKGNLIKYILRSGRKDDEVQDLSKGSTYLVWLIEQLEDDSE